MEINVAMEITAAVHVGETAVVTGTAEGAAAGIISAARARLVRVAPWAVPVRQAHRVQWVPQARQVRWG